MKQLNIAAGANDLAIASTITSADAFLRIKKMPAFRWRLFS
jgi:hypothetical protein